MAEGLTCPQGLLVLEEVGTPSGYRPTHVGDLLEPMSFGSLMLMPSGFLALMPLGLWALVPLWMIEFGPLTRPF